MARYKLRAARIVERRCAELGKLHRIEAHDAPRPAASDIAFEMLEDGRAAAFGNMEKGDSARPLTGLLSMVSVGDVGATGSGSGTASSSCAAVNVRANSAEDA